MRVRGKFLWRDEKVGLVPSSLTAEAQRARRESQRRRSKQRVKEKPRFLFTLCAPLCLLCASAVKGLSPLVIDESSCIVAARLRNIS
jgi:hypothetical protein